MKKYGIAQKGSVMIEALAMLGLIAMVTPILYRKAADRTQELQDINIASQLRMISEAVDSYIKDNYSTMNTICAGPDCGYAVNDDDPRYLAIQEYLPAGFAFNSSKLFDGFEIGINKKLIGGTHNLFTSAVVAKLRNDMQQSRASKIATMVGANGGIVSGSGFSGTQGVWNATADQFGLDVGDIKDNSLVAISSSLGSEEEESADTADYLYRTYQTDINRNTMSTTLYMAGNNIDSVNKLIANGTSTFTTASELQEGDGVVTIPNRGNLLVDGMLKVVSDLFSPKATITDLAASNIAATSATITNLTASGILASQITAASGEITDLTASGITASQIKAAKGEITNLTASVINASQITAASGEITNLTASGIAASQITATDGTITNLTSRVINTSQITATEGTIVNLTASGILASQITATDGTIVNLTASGITASQITASELTVTDKAFFKVNTFGIGGVSATSYNQSGNMVVINDTESFFGKDYSSDIAYRKGLTVNANDVWLTNNNTTMLQNDAGWHFGIGSSGNSITSYANSSGSTEQEPKNPQGVYIDRGGVIELATPGAGEGFNKGFIRARRLVSDVKYVDPYKGAERSDLNNLYSYYQVNPAYTSIMNDIRLASRGGARLSDILPDYINKGIYVADSTVNNFDFTWDTITSLDALTGLSHCASSEPGCLVSPFMGGVRAPQCPYGYEAAITIEPFRFKVAETYLISSSIPDFSAAAAIGAANQNNPNLEPFHSGFRKLANVSEEVIDVAVSGLTVANNTVTGTIKIPEPKLLQANTWLNTNIQQIGYEGWGVVMGFMYLLNSPANGEYTQLAQAAGMQFDGLTIAWNMFPVYNQELAAVVKVYCFFNRDRENDGDVDDVDWGEQVYKYDQLNTPSYYSRDADWINAVTDPTMLGVIGAEQGIGGW